MAENDNLMDAIREDALANEQHEEELKRIEDGIDSDDESDGLNQAPAGAAIKTQDGLSGKKSDTEDRRPGLHDEDDDDGYSDDKADSDNSNPHLAKQLDTVNEEDPQSKNQSKSNLGSGNLQLAN